MRFYELTYLISPEVSKDELRELREKINSIIQKEGGVLNEASLPMKRDLAYPIQKQKEAFFINLNFYFEPEKMKNLEKELKSEKKILRYLILATTPIKVPLAKERKMSKPKKPKKVELKEIEKKLEEILGE